MYEIPVDVFIGGGLKGVIAGKVKTYKNNMITIDQSIVRGQNPYWYGLIRLTLGFSSVLKIDRFGGGSADRFTGEKSPRLRRRSAERNVPIWHVVVGLPPQFRGGQSLRVSLQLQTEMAHRPDDLTANFGRSPKKPRSRIGSHMRTVPVRFFENPSNQFPRTGMIGPILGNEKFSTANLQFPKLGTTIPIMGNEKPVSISDVLFSGVQQKVLGLLFGQPDRSFYANELATLGMTGRGALQRELQRMTSSGLISVTLIGRQKHYQANKNMLIYHELRGIVLKTFGLSDILRQALSESAHNITSAFIYGSVAKGTDTATSDIDLMVIADGLSYSHLFEALTKAEEMLGRKVNPTLYSPEDFAKKLRNDNHFVTRVLNQPKIILIGDENAISSGKPTEPAEDREAEGGAT
jgi:predicted nucleotidyltransferase